MSPMPAPQQEPAHAPSTYCHLLCAQSGRCWACPPPCQQTGLAASPLHSQRFREGPTIACMRQWTGSACQPCFTRCEAESGAAAAVLPSAGGAVLAGSTRLLQRCTTRGQLTFAGHVLGLNVHMQKDPGAHSHQGDGNGQIGPHVLAGVCIAEKGKWRMPGTNQRLHAASQR